jgi:hypothetical protein
MFKLNRNNISKSVSLSLDKMTVVRLRIIVSTGLRLRNKIPRIHTPSSDFAILSDKITVCDIPYF